MLSSAVLSTSTSAPAAPPSTPAPLPALRQDLQLLPAPPHPDGAPSWRIHDPVRNRFFELGWMEFELLSRWQPGISCEDLSSQTAAETPLDTVAADAGALLDFLRQHGLVACDAAGRETLRQRVAGARPPWWKQAVHNYLFFRVPLLHPDRFLGATLPRVAPLFSHAFLLLTLAAGILGLYLATRQADALAGSFSYFFSLEGLLSYGVAATFAKILHELGHAYTAKRMGLRVPTMGVAFLVMWPVLYTDTGESWKLAQPARRFAIASAGMAAELALACWTTLAWALFPDGIVRSGLFLLATTSWLITLAINLSPFMRFDGYFLLSDALNLPNLHERSSALARAALRRAFFGLREADTEPTMGPRMRRWLIGFALATWTYRLVLFIGIALMVYHLFFKLLGILLMAIEIGWFILRPLAAEWKVLMEKRPEWRLRPRAWALLGLAVLALLWTIPVARQLGVPALVRNAEASAVYAAMPARVAEVMVADGRHVAAGAPLLRLEAPELESRLERAGLRAAALREELARTPANATQRERRLVLEQELGEALADEAGAREQLARLVVLAPQAGRVRDLMPGLVAGSWVQPRHALLRVVGSQGVEIDAYVGEQMLRALAVGDDVKFYPELPESPVLRGRVVAIDPAAGRQVPPLLASTNGGAVAATRTQGGELVAHEALYRVRIKPQDGAAMTPAVMRGTVRVQAGWDALAPGGLAHALSVLVRETGF